MGRFCEGSTQQRTRSKSVFLLAVLFCVDGCKAYIEALEVLRCMSAGRKNLSLPPPPFFLSHLLLSSPVRVGQDAGRIQTQEFPDERRDLPLPYCNAQCVSRNLLQTHVMYTSLLCDSHCFFVLHSQIWSSELNTE